MSRKLIILRKINLNNFRAKIIDQLFSILDLRGSNFLSYSSYSLEVPCNSAPSPFEDFSDTLVLMQGPILSANKKIFWIIKNYLSNYNNILIMISTWEGKDLDNANKVLSHFTDIEKKQIRVIANPIPSNPGIANINLQIFSTIKGLNEAKLTNRKYVVKTRTDQALVKHNAISILKHNWNSFNGTDKVLEKIVIGSRNTFLFRFYSFSDMLQFGTIGGLISFWETPLDKRTTKDFQTNSPRSAKDWASMNVAEVYLVRNYLQRKGVSTELTLESHLNALAKCFIVIDSEILGFAWTKYGYRFSPWQENGFPYVKYEISHHDWLNIIRILQNSKVLEAYSERDWR